MIDKVVVGDLDTNCWIIRAPGTNEAALIDPGAEPDRILQAVDGLDIRAIVLTHAHYDHVLAIPILTHQLKAPVLAHPAEKEVWQHELAHLEEHGHFDAGTATEDLLAVGRPPRATGQLWDGTVDRPLQDADTIAIGELEITVKHTPGHSPGSICLAIEGHLFTGDTLFPGGPGLTGAQWPLTSFEAIMRSIRGLLADTPDETQIHPGHGRDTTVGAERPHLREWATRGW
ncbi:MBL fold metallo-hydrolase [Tenggerimyces flavus]|uniref:MBL fold metallo-hydrolase n=1 Tax=Tenggerimyces flavus TaxID=1708749 RepID=A0ABV7Y7F7_9ACTN|nr:MBL fold metallo-hydrolase [Tenggerimyces flavus]MBM7785667.1 hydroxyacylglutathione hydrolase [Tenggerimyces flavus]